MKRLFAIFLTIVTVFSVSVFRVDSVNLSGTLALSAKSAVLIDCESHSILYSKDHDAKMGMASTTKIMTALVAAESTDLKRTVVVSPEAVGVEGSSVYLYEGERITIEELLYALLLQSANDAAEAIAIAVAGSVGAFADMMNARAAQMGLKNTHFTNPHGLSDDEHYTTAHDLAVITAHALKNETLRTIVSTYKKSIPIDSDCNPRLLVNHNKMLKLYDGAIGVKTGFTKTTGRCLVSAAEREGLTVIAVTLDAPDDWNDHKKLLDFGFDNYESLLVAEAGSFIYPLSVVGGDEPFVSLTNTQDIRLTVPKIRGELKCKIETLHRFEFAPILRGTDAGSVTYSYEGMSSSSSALVCAENIGISKKQTKENQWNQ